MDRKSIIILVSCFAALMLWYPLVNKLYPPKPLPPGATNQIATVTSSNGLASAATGVVSDVSTSAPRPLVEKAEAPSLVAAPAVTNVPTEEQIIQVTNELAHYIFTSRGGGLKEVELLNYPEQVDRKSKRSPARRVATLNSSSPAASLAISGGLQGDGDFRLTPITSGVRAEKTLTNGLTIVKDFKVTTNYLVLASVRIENRSSVPLALPAQDWIIGTAAPLGEDDQGTAVGAMWYDGKKTHEAGATHFSSQGFMCTPRTPPSEYRGGESNVVWAGIKNQFFSLVVMPETVAQSIVVQKLNLPKFSSEAATPPAGYIAAITYPESILQPNQVIERKVHIFAGPKDYQTLAKLANSFGNNVDLVMGFGFFGWFAKALLLAMNWLHNGLSFSYGWAIVAITVIIKLLFWPLTAASTRSMKRMAALQPQMKAIQVKYKEDPAKMNRKTMEFMKEHKVSPLGGCLPMLLQIPVFFGFYQMIQSAIELRGASWLWVADLSKPDTLFLIPGTQFPFNLLPLLMGVTMFWQARLTPPSPGMDPTQAKIMRYMPLMFMVFLYNFSAGLTLYWTVQNILTIVQTKLTKTNEPAPGAAPVPALTAHPKKKK